MADEKKLDEANVEAEVENTEAEVEAKPAKEDKQEESKKDQVEKKIRKQIEKKQEKDSKFGIAALGEYLKEEHKWENYVFVVVALITLLLGCLIIEGSIEVKENFPVIGTHSTAFAWVLIGVSALGLLYALWPFFKPSFPELKKITWLTWPKFLANLARVFIFMIIFVALLYLYDAFISNIFVLIFS
ncbi:MAG: preprotein translocase subunit SecE [Acholeplasmatales bacterium]|nr:preprotein translocase subunit SecE [Acholeplasmatales bacterium]